jgi:hypothetical protein
VKVKFPTIVSIISPFINIVNPVRGK